MEASSNKNRTDKKAIPFKEGLFYLPHSGKGEPHLVGSRCKNCGRTFFPKCVICVGCFRDDMMEEVILSRRGRLHSHCISQIAPPGFKPPYAMGYIDLPEGVRLFSLLSLDEPSEELLRDGMEVELVIEKLKKDEEGTDLLCYKFRPLR